MFEAIRRQAHAGLMDRMARAVTGAALPAAERAAALDRCCACGEAGACEDWLADHPAGADAAPRFCANRATLDALRPAEG